MLHGTGGDESSLLAFADSLDPSAGVLSPRGKVLEKGMPRFFRRVAEGVFDLEDLVLRTHELADFITESAITYGFDLGGVIAFGYSNGANIAASMLLLRPEVLGGGILVRAMVPLEPQNPPDLKDKRVLILAGTRDPYAPREQTERLEKLLAKGGAKLTVRYQESGHDIAREEIDVARDWLAEQN